MSITTHASNGVIFTTSAKSGTVKSFTGGKVRLEDPITTGNNGQLETTIGPVYTGRLIYIDGGTGVGQTRFVSGETTGLGDGDDVDLDVNDPWTTNPDGTSTYQISYIVEDAATLTGCSLQAKTDVYEFARRMVVGSGGGTFAFFFSPGDKAIEHRDNSSTTIGSATVEDGGRWDNGYLLNGVPVSGAYQFAINIGLGELALDCKVGSITNFYDFNLRGARADNLITIDGGTHDWRKGKIFKVTEANFLSGTMTMEDWTWEGLGTANNALRIEDTITILSCVMTSMNGFDSLDDTLTEVMTVRNCNFVNVFTRTVRVHDDKTWNFVDPLGWIANSTAIAFQVDDLNEVNLLHALALVITTPGGTAIEGAETFVFEGTLNSDLPTANKQTTDANGEASSDVLEEKYTYPASVFTTTTSGDHAVKIYKWLRNPFVSAQVFDDTLALVGLPLPVALSLDSGIVETDEANAVEGGNGIANIVRHGTGETDTRAVKVMHYDGGTGSAPTIGETVTEGTATGDVLDYEGDGVTGILVLENWNGTEFTNNQVATGGASTFSASCDISGGGSSFYEAYTWVWDLGGKSLQGTYDYQAAKFAARRHPIAKQDDAAVFTTFSDEAKSEVAGDVDLLPTTPAQNDRFYFGDLNFPFERITIDISSAATTSTVGWEYWNGSWTSLSGVTDNTTNFTTTGKNTIEFTLPTDWAKTTIDGVNAFWIRAVQNNASPSGQAVASRVWLDELIERLIEWGEEEHAYHITVTPAGFRTDRNVSLAEGVWLANRGAGDVDVMTADDGTEYTPPASVTLSVTVLDDDTGSAIANTAHVYIEIVAGHVELLNSAVDGSGIASAAYSFTGDQAITGWVREMSQTGTDYHPKDISGTIESTGFSLTVRLAPLPN